MDADSEIPIPIRFNPLKHHLKYIQELFHHASLEMITDLLGPVCNNYIDIYTGEMTPEIISHSVIGLLKSKQVLQKDGFTCWVAAKNGYRKIRLEDESEWIVRKSDESDRYIHLHPARTGAFTIRFKGSTLKTIFLLKTNPGGQAEKISTDLINRARKQINLSPVSSLDRCKGIIKCYFLFSAPKV
jgi:hypothetical protein